jgi:hypothetical protein
MNRYGRRAFADIKPTRIAAGKEAPCDLMSNSNAVSFEPGTISGSRPAQPLGPAGEFGRSGSALVFLEEDAVCAYLDRVGQVIVI